MLKKEKKKLLKQQNFSFLVSNVQLSISDTMNL